jgi:MFS family permease
MVGNPFFGRLSDRTASHLGMRRPWMVIGLLGGSLGILVVAVAPTVPVVLVGWCIAQLFFNALLAAMVAVLAVRGCRDMRRHRSLPDPAREARPMIPGQRRTPPGTNVRR